MRPATHAAAPDRRTSVDLGLLLGLLVVTLAGLAPTYQGWAFLAVGLAGAVLAAGAVLLVRALAWPSIAAVLLTLVLCYLLGPVAWVMGAGDLREMRAARMDPSGMGTTQAGYICGIIGSCLAILGICIAILWIVFAVILGAAAVAGAGAQGHP